jgi:hypothetical protein
MKLETNIMINAEPLVKSTSQNLSITRLKRNNLKTMLPAFVHEVPVRRDYAKGSDKKAGIISFEIKKSEQR